jgi:hypothetical protein
MKRSFLVFLLLGVAGFGPALAAPASGGLSITLEQGFQWQGFSMFTIVMALLYAGHLAQDRTSLGWRVVLFVLGFPLTFVVSFLVVPGSQRVLGVDLPRHDRPVVAASESPGPSAEAAESEDSSQGRKAEWDGVIAMLVGVSMVFLFAPSTEYLSQPLDAEQLVVEKTVSWGFWETPWLSYRREGVQARNDDPGWTDPEWVTDREWTFEASIEALLTLFMLLLLVALCVRDERVRTRILEGNSAGTQRAD